jgi:ligand-binding sensor domain-containing protein
MVTEPEQVYQSEGNIWLPTTMWPDTGNAIHYVSLQDILVNSSNEIFVATDFAGVFKTEDEGTNWTIVNDGFIKFDTDTTYFVSALTSMSNSIYSGNTDLSTIGGIFSLESSAEKWNPRVIWEEYSYVATLETNSKGEIFAGCKSGLYYSQDAGKNWIDVGQDLNWASLAYAYTVAFDSNDKVYIGTRDGMYMSENRGDSWAQLGLASEAVLSIAINSKDEIFASLENEEIMRSTDGGMTWEEVLKLDGNNIRHLFINLNDIIFVSTWKGIYRSNDNGANFEHIGLENTSIEKIVINSEGHMIAGSYRDGIFISKE